MIYKKLLLLLEMVISPNQIDLCLNQSEISNLPQIEVTNRLRRILFSPRTIFSCRKQTIGTPRSCDENKFGSNANLYQPRGKGNFHYLKDKAARIEFCN